MEKQTKYVAYYRVSTEKQGESGAGLDAQKVDVMRFAGGSVFAEFTEVESGACDDRPVLDVAIKTALMHDATLVIAKLDRLSRKASMVMALKDTGVKFVCTDMPDANSLTIGIMASIGQHEREMIAERTRKAIRTKIDNGQVWGNPQNFSDAGREKGRTARTEKARTNGNNLKAFVMASDMMKAGFSLRTIANRLNQFGFVTSRGNKFHANSIKQLMKVMDGVG
jgi:DNA invertase Pin-like site-specific DNA recombinase